MRTKAEINSYFQRAEGIKLRNTLFYGLDYLNQKKDHSCRSKIEVDLQVAKDRGLYRQRRFEFGSLLFFNVISLIRQWQNLRVKLQTELH